MDTHDVFLLAMQASLPVHLYGFRLIRLLVKWVGTGDGCASDEGRHSK